MNDIEERLTCNRHPWISRYIRDSGLTGGRLLAGRQRIDNGRCSSRLVVELCRRCHGRRCGRHGRGSGRGRNEATGRSAVLMMMTESIVNHRIGRCRCHIAGETSCITARFVAGSRGIHSGGCCQGSAGRRRGPETGHHTRRGAERGCRNRLLLLMMMMRRCSGHVGIHTGRCTRRR